MLSPEEKIRYSRHIDLENIGSAGQEKLKDASILIVGVGGLGCTVAMELAAAGIGHIGLADNDVVSISNLQRQLLYKPGDKGAPKVEIAKKRITQINNHTRVTISKTFITEQNGLEIIDPFDIIIDCTDDIKTKLLCNQICLQLGKPLVYGALYKFEGQVSSFNYKGGPSYTDAFPNVDITTPVPSCTAIGIYAIIPHIIASLQANEILKMILEIGSPLSGKLLTYNALTNQFLTIQFSRRTK